MDDQLQNIDVKKTLSRGLIDLSLEEEQVIEQLSFFFWKNRKRVNYTKSQEERKREEVEVLDSWIFPHTSLVSKTLQKLVSNVISIKKIVSIEFTSPYAILREFIINVEEDKFTFSVTLSKVLKGLLDVRKSKLRYSQYLFNQQHLIRALKFGDRARKHGNFHNFLLFSQKWNEMMDKNITPTSHMWYLYNKIQKKHRAPLRRFRYNSDKFERLKVYQELEIDLGTSGFPPGFFEEWFILRDKMPGIKCLIKINIVNKINGLGETYFIRNTRSTWNKNGIEPFLFSKKTGARRKILDNLMETINPNNPQFSDIRTTLKDELICELIVMDIGFPEDSGLARNGFKKIYRLKYDETFLDDYLEIKFWEYVNSLKPSWIPRYKNLQKIVSRFEENGKRVISITDEQYNPQIFNFTKIYLQDKTDLYANIFTEINNLRKFHNSPCKAEEWWNEVKSKLTPMDLAKVIQKVRMQNKTIHDTNIIYSLDQAEKNLNIGLDRNLKEFLDENNSKGLPAFVGAALQDSKNRHRITMLTKKLNRLECLNLTENVVSEIKWGFIKTSKNLITFPDNITRSKGKACEIVQTKIVRELGNETGNLRVFAYLFDELKTIGSYDSSLETIKNLQIEFIPKGNILNNHTDIAKDFNALIISYWGVNTKEFGRLMEVVSAIRQSIFKLNIKDPNILLTHVIDILNEYGEKAIGFRRVLDNKTRRIISELIGITNLDVGEEMLMRDILLYILKNTQK